MDFQYTIFSIIRHPYTRHIRRKEEAQIQIGTGMGMGMGMEMRTRVHNRINKDMQNTWMNRRRWRRTFHSLISLRGIRLGSSSILALKFDWHSIFYAHMHTHTHCFCHPHRFQITVKMRYNKLSIISLWLLMILSLKLTKKNIFHA